MSEIPVTKKQGLQSLCARKMHSFFLFFLASFCDFFTIFIPGRTSLHYYKYINLSFPRNPLSPVPACVVSVPPFDFLLILIKLALKKILISCPSHVLCPKT